MNLLCTAIKDIFFFVCLFFLLTITGRIEAIIVKLKELFVLNGTFITCDLFEVPIIRFLAITKNDASSRL